MTGVKLQEIIDVLNVFNVITMYSFPDIISLAFIAKQLPLISKISHQELAKVVKDIPTTEAVPFDFFTHKHFGLADFSVVNPRIKEQTPNQKLVSKQA